MKIMKIIRRKSSWNYKTLDRLLSAYDANAVQLLVDEDVLKGEYVGCHPCINTSSIRIKTDDLFGIVLEAMHHTMRLVKLTGEA